ncbi:MAG: serine/threonine-protein kinase, partial [Dokdonella sp.]|uniref:serine/threonine-protein kinase n=1 Tax=Dokdonella sp. TaxID=2291710 RepID=UPI0032658024
RRLLARIEHPNVARILDGGATDTGVPYLVMEYVDGASLTAYSERHSLDVATRVALFCKVCEGVQAAHRHLIIHRDLKPQNILVGSDGEPRLLDFGIARTLDPEPGPSALFTSTLAMTPAYASPEQVRLEPLTTASDVYSLGVVLYELLTGTRPYSLAGLSPAQSEAVICNTAPHSLRHAIERGDLPEPERRARVARLDGDLERIVAKALHKEPARRYGSAEAFADDLRRHLDGRPVLAHPDSAGYRLSRFVRRHRLGTAAAAVALATIALASTIALIQARESRRSAADAQTINGFLLDMLKVSDPYASGSEISLGDALDIAAKKVDERFGDRPEIAVDVRNALGESMFARYRLNAADAQLTRSRDDAERLLGADDPRTILAMATLASVRKEQDRTDEAQALFDQALTRLERSGQATSPLHATVLNDVGVMHLIQEDFSGAAAYLQRAIDSDRGSTAPAAIEERARTLANLAQAERGLGHLDRAEALYEKAQPVLEAVYPNGGPPLAVILNNRARLAWARGDKERAIVLQQQAVAMHQHSFSGDHVMVLVPMTNLARQALDVGKLDLASEWAEKAVAMADRMYAKSSHHYQVNAVAALAATRLAQGRTPEAIELVARTHTLLAGLDNVPASTRDYVDNLTRRVCERSGPPTLDCAPTS